MTDTPSQPSQPSTPSTTIAVPRWLVWGGGGALVLCLMSFGYFVGRESARPATVSESVVATAVERSAPPAEPAAAATPRRLPAPVGAGPTTEPSTPAASTPTPARTSPTPPRPAPAPAPVERLSAAEPANPQRDAVSSYFAQVDAIGAGGGLSADDPEQLAMAILSQATTGDATAFDQLANAQESSLAALRRVQPPAAAQEHHRRSVALLEQSTRLLARLKEGLLNGNIAALGELSAQAEQMKSQAEGLDRLAAEIRQRAGLD
ncbi:MAG: hypothetical protein QF634_09860 [Vicinamibacterales bacterium]|nr:hypothetical protein [Vicinamibacterales bacterium]